jgi:F0F1-type ATP synthase membrane subunit b/b'
VIVLDAEFQLTACFILFLSTMYTQVGPMVGKALDDYGNEVQKELKALDSTIQGQIQSAIATNEEALTLKEDFHNLYTLTDQLAVAQAEVLTNIEGHKYREAIVKKLESLYALEESASTAIRNRVVSNVQKEVVKTFKTDKKAQENALNQAIAVLAAGSGAKLGKDVVGEAFVASIAAYKANYAKQPAGSDEILVQLEKDIAAVATAPAVHEQGGNVFLTNPVL